MKMNASMAGSNANDSLANKFYYHIPHPSVPYANSNLKDYGKDAYTEEQLPQTTAYNYNSQYP